MIMRVTVLQFVYDICSLLAPLPLLLWTIKNILIFLRHLFAFEGVQERLSNCCLCGQDVSEVSRVTTVRFTCPNSVFI